MRVKEMAKPKKLRDTRIEAEPDERIDPAQEVREAMQRIKEELATVTPEDVAAENGIDSGEFITTALDIQASGIAFTITPPPTEPTIMTGTEIDEPIVLKPRRYVPPACSVCTNLRRDGKNYTEVYRTARETGYIFRYCKCGFCGNTFKDSEKV